MPLIKFSCKGGMRCPNTPYTTEAIAQKPAADKAANSPVPLVKPITKKLLKMILTPQLSLKTIFIIYQIMGLKISTLSLQVLNF